MEFFTKRIASIKQAVDIKALRPIKVPAVVFWGFLSAVLPKDSSLREKCNTNYIMPMIEPFLKYYDKTQDIYVINEMKIPSFPNYVLHPFLMGLALEHSAFYCKYFDEYDKIDLKEYCRISGETPYCYPIEKNNVLIEKDDIVIDAGAWVGDFSAYSIAHGAKACYAFEPTEDTMHYLRQIEMLNPGVIPVQSGLSNRVGEAYFSSDSISVGNRIADEGNIVINLTTLDNFVIENKLPRVDFIKADIEGAERDMLVGAKNALREFAPKLSICTYHLPDDPQVLEKLILEANPNYTVIQGSNKIYAYDKRRRRIGDTISFVDA